MIKTLKQLSNRTTDESLKGFQIIKYPHPDAGKKPTSCGPGFGTEQEAKDYCERPESSFREGPTSDWYYLGYAQNGSRSWEITLW